MFNRFFGTPDANTKQQASGFAFSLPSISFQPLKSIGYQNVSRFTIGALVLLQHSRTAEAYDAMCLSSDNHDSYTGTGLYAIRTSGQANIPSGKYQIQTANFKIPMTAEACDYDYWVNRNYGSRDYSVWADGRKLFGGDTKYQVCEITYDSFYHYSRTAHPAVKNFIMQYCSAPDDVQTIITAQDKVMLGVISTSGLYMLGGITYCAYNAYKKAYAPNPIRDIEQGLLDEDAREEVANNWEALEERIEALAESHPEQSRELVAAFRNALDDFKCPIGYIVMSDPVTLPCRHSFDKASLLANLRRENDVPVEHTCSMCHDEVDPNAIKTNEMLKAAIDFKYRYFDREATRLENASVHSANVSLSSSGSSLFTSVKSAFSSSEESEEEQELNLAGASTLNSCGIM